MFFIYFFLGDVGVDGGLGFGDKLIFSKLSCGCDVLGFFVICNGFLEFFEGRFEIGVSIGKVFKVCCGIKFFCIIFLVFKNRGFKGGWGGLEIDFKFDGGFDNLENIWEEVGLVCWIIWEKELFSVGVMIELKKLCFFKLLFVIVGEENNLFSVRLVMGVVIFRIFIFLIILFFELL